MTEFVKNNLLSLLNFVLIVGLFCYLYSIQSKVDSISFKMDEIPAKLDDIKNESTMNNVKMDYLDSDINKRNGDDRY